MSNPKILGQWVFGLVLCFIAALRAEDSNQPPPEVVEELGPNYQLLHQGYSAGKEFISASPADVAHEYDVQKYTLNLRLSPAEMINKLKACATLQVKSTSSNFSTLSLDFVGLTVDSCKINSELTNFSRVSEKLNINLKRVYVSGEIFTADVYYHGYPQAGMYFGLNKYGSSVIYTRTQPYKSKYWFPCYDLPSDKALAEVICTAPAGREVISNGNLMDVAANSDNTVTYHWMENYPVATYLISLAVSDYAQIEDVVDLGPEQLPIYYWVYHQDSSKALADFANTPEMITYFSDRYGKYPFGSEKFSIAQAGLSGAMEHQTCVSWGLPIEGNFTYEWVVAHELAHHWWGNLVTCQDFANIWLNEGFATYSEALWKEEHYGTARFMGHMQGLEWHVINDSAKSVAYPIYDPPPEYLFGIGVYRKGAWVVHMLRHILGDQAFFEGLRSYGETYAYGTANTEQFKDEMESKSGKNLDWFFDQWVYRANFPKYKWSWVYTQLDGKYFVDISLTQEQTTPAFFGMPVDFRIETSSGTSSLTWYNSTRYQKFSLALTAQPGGITFDPDNWLLGMQSQGSYPAIAGDLTGDGQVRLGDVIMLVNLVLKNGPPPSPVALADVDGSCAVTLTDVIHLSNFLLGRGPAPNIGCSTFKK